MVFAIQYRFSNGAHSIASEPVLPLVAISSASFETAFLNVLGFDIKIHLVPGPANSSLSESTKN